MSQWYADGDNRFDSLWRWVGIGGAALLVVGVAYLAGQRALGLASERLTPGLTHGAAREMGGDPTGSAVPRFSPAMPGRAITPVASGSGFSSVPALPPPPVNLSAALGPPGSIPLTDAERAEARQGLLLLRDALETTRKYDSSSFWQAPQAGGSAKVVESGSSSNPSRGNTGDSDAAERYVDKVKNDADGLATQLDLAAHPERYPRPLRDGVGEMARELRVYLNTTQLASSRPDDQQRLRGLAAKHLSRSDEILRQLETQVGVTGGAGGSAAN